MTADLTNVIEAGAVEQRWSDDDDLHLDESSGGGVVYIERDEEIRSTVRPTDPDVTSPRLVRLKQKKKKGEKKRKKKKKEKKG
jgi:hypothetical protein